MAARVNKKFVIILSAAVIAGAAGVATLGAYYMQNRPVQFMQKADAFAAQGDWDNASRNYERAVGYDRTNVVWLEKWLDALSKTIPDNRARYEEQYGFYRNIKRQISDIKRREPDAVMAYATEVDRGVRASGLNREELERAIGEFTKHTEDLDPDDAKTKAILVLRGLAQVDRMSLMTVEQKDREQSLKDLRAGVEADPKNVEARVGEIRWHLAEAERLRRDLRPAAEVDPLMARARELTAKMVEVMPDEPQATLMSFMLNQGEEMRTAVTIEKRREATAKIKSEALKMIDTVLAAPAEKYQVDMIDRVTGVALNSVGEEAIEPLLALVNRGLERFPNDARLMLAKGQLQLEGKLVDEAVKTFQQVVDLPEIPVSLEGMLLPNRRIAAMAAQIDAALLQWNEAKEEDVKAKALERAKQFRDRLAKDAGIRGEAALLSRDARIAFAERKYDVTVAKISDLTSRGGGDDPQSLQLLAQALEMQGLRGEAIRQLERLRDKVPNYAWTYEKIGDLYTRENRLALAAEAYRTALQMNPDNDALKRRLATINSAMGDKAAGENQLVDVVVRGLMESRKLRSEGDAAGARAALDKLEQEFPGDTRIVVEQIQADVTEGKRDLAIERLNKALVAKPDDAGFKRIKTYLEISDPVEASLKIIETSEATDLQKHLQRFSVLVSAGRGEDAKKELAAAEQTSPDDPMVVDLLFVSALSEKNFDRAQQLVQKAAKLNLDQVDGMLYQGRLELIEGESKPDKRGAAVSTFEQVVKKTPFNPTARRLLGQAYQRAGRVGDALEMFKRAYEGNLSDAPTVRDYVNGLIAANRGEEALLVINPRDGALSRIGNDQDLLNTWLVLEAKYGQREIVARTREAMMQRDPKDSDNAIALAGLYVEDKKYDQADKILSDLEKAGQIDKLRLAGLRAEVAGRRGDVDAGVKAMQDAITEDMPKDQKLRAYLTLSAFLNGRDRKDEAVAALRKAREFQNPDNAEADRALGDFYFNKSMSLNPSAMASEDSPEAQSVPPERREEALKTMDVAASHYADAMKTVKDESIRGVIGRRLAEVYLRIKKPDQARTMVDELSAKNPDEMQLLLLRGAIADAQGDRRVARQMFDKAVQLNPGNPLAYIQRANFNLRASDQETVKGMLPDILQDYEQVCRLRPDMTGAWVRRFELLSQFGRKDDGLTVIRQAIDANPADRDLRLLLMQQLSAAGRTDEMQQEIQRAIAARPDDDGLLLLAAQMFASPKVQRWPDAAKYFGLYYDRNKSPETAGTYLDAMLRPSVDAPRARIQEVLKVWEPTAKKDAIIDIMLRARVRKYVGESEDAKKLYDEAYALTREKSSKEAQEFMGWLILAETDSKGPGLRSAIEFLIDKIQLDREKMHPFLRSQLLVVRSLQPKANPKALIEEGASWLEDPRSDDLTRFELHKGISRIQYAVGDFKPASVSMQEALKIDENDVEMNNNLAYTMITHLDQPAEAIKYATKAAQAKPNDATIVDTLGWAYYKMGQYSQAVEHLTRAAQMATSSNDRFVAFLHLGHAHEKAGDKAEARKALRAAEEIASQPKDAPPSAGDPAYKALLESLRKAVN